MVLSDFYIALNSPVPQVEVIFASLDENKESFESYYSKMPWLSLPFEEKELIEGLSRKYNVQTIPTLLLVNSNGDVLADNCRNLVVSKGNAALEVFKSLLPK